MPCSFETAHPTRFDGPPRVIAAGFQMAYGNFVGPVDLFKDVAFDLTRKRCLEITDYMRAQGPFEPARLPMKDMEYTTLPHVMKVLAKRFVDTE
jgi:fructose 1,6-bisphosphate aldolase/phosphatase